MSDPVRGGSPSLDVRLMLSKILKSLAFVVGGAVVLVLVGWVGFHAKEYMAGNEYVDYLEANMSSAPSGQALDFELVEEDLAAHSLILVGEIHGFADAADLDVRLFSHLLATQGVSHYLAEVDYSQAYFLNRYNETGADSLLAQALENWVVRIGRDNRDYHAKYAALREAHETLGPFRYVGVNPISDVSLLYDHLNELDPSAPVRYDADQPDSLNVLAARSEVQRRLSVTTDSVRQSEYAHLLRTLDDAVVDRHREEALTTNVRRLYADLGLKDETVYGFFGLGHTLLAPAEGGYAAMASRLSDADDWFEGNILSINLLFLDSYMTMPSRALPSFMQDDGPYTRLPTSYDNLLVSYLYGIKDLERVTEPGTTTLFKMNAPGSPYLESDRLFRMTQLLPLGQLLNAQAGRGSADYGQYVVLIRDSDWAEPFSSVN